MGLKYIEARSGWRLYILALALAVYALWGAPTPDMAGPAELAVGLLLMAALAGAPLLYIFRPARTGPLWHKGGAGLLLYGLSVPVITGLAADNNFTYMMRDLAAFLFMMLPLFIVPYWRRGHKAMIWKAAIVISGAALFIGILFAGRIMAPVLFWGAPFSDPAYHVNAPTVLYAGLLCAGLAGWFIWRSMSLAAHLKAALLIVPAFLIFTAMALVFQRASLGYSLIAFTGLLALAAIAKPARLGWLLAVIILAGLAVWPFLETLAAGLFHKTALVGVNLRDQEIRAVITALDDGGLGRALFGTGWGAAYVSPAAGGVSVNYTHSLLTSYILKTGWAGLMLVLIYLAGFAQALYRIVLYNPLMAAALAGPFLIDIFLYASYKSLDFGVLLLIIALWGECYRRDILHEGQSCSNEKEASPDNETALTGHG